MYLMTLDRAMEQEVQIDEERKWVHLKTGTHLEDGRKSLVLSESALRSSLFLNHVSSTPPLPSLLEPRRSPEVSQLLSGF